MLQKLRNWTLAVLMAGVLGGATVGVAVPATANAACVDRFLTFPTWYRGLTDGSCNFQALSGANGLRDTIWKIALNIVEIILQLVGYVSVGFIIYGGFRYLTSAGSPDGNAKSRKTIINAIIGLVISIFSVGIVNVVAGAIR